MSRTHATARLVTFATLAFLCGAASSTRVPAAPFVKPAFAEPFHLVDLAQQVEAPATQVPTRPAFPADQGDLGEARAFSRAFADVAAAVTPAVVRIQAERSLMEAHPGLRHRLRDMLDRLPEGHPDPELYPEIAGGTGVVVSADGLVLTNNHVIGDADRITVTLADKRVYDATVVGTDPTTDVALIRIHADDLPVARLGDSDGIRVGEWVLAIGNPGFQQANTLDFTVTGGIVSAKGRPLDIIRQELVDNQNAAAAAYAIEDFIQTDAAINPGNSGGPLVDLDGRVIGINTAIASVSGYNEGYGFAVPINMARRVMNDLLEHGRVRRPLLGISIQTISPEDAEVYGLPRIAGVLVEDFADASPAERAGLRRHDVVVAVDGTSVDRLGQFQRLVASHQPGETVGVDVIRYGQKRHFSVRLAEAQLGKQAVVHTSPPATESDLGIEVVDLTPSLARQQQFRSAGGALISAVSPAGAAMRKGVEPGLLIREINREGVSSAADAERILRALPSGSVASLVLQTSDGGTLIRNVRVP